MVHSSWFMDFLSMVLTRLISVVFWGVDLKDGHYYRL